MIDGDGRSQGAVDTLRDRGVFALDAFSVESLYYCSESLDAVARWQEESLGRESDSMMQPALDAAFAALAEDGLAERMAARRCEHVVRNRIVSQTPNWETIRDDGQTDIKISVTSPFQQELATFRELVEVRNLDQLVARYPLRESGVFAEVAHALDFKKRDLYEQTLIARVQSDSELAEKLRQRVGPLSIALGVQSPGPLEDCD